MYMNRPARTGASALLLWFGFTLVGFLGISLPPVTSGFDSLQRWAQERSGIEIVMGFLRLGGHLLCAYVLSVSTLAVIARATRWSWPAQLAGAVTPQRLRPVVGLVIGASVAAAAATSMTAGAGERPTIATMYAEEPELPVAPARRIQPATTTTLASPPAHTVATDGREADVNASDVNTADVTTAGATAVEVAAAETWMIRPGDNLWFVAEETLRDEWGRPPTDAEIVPYWRDLIELNRDVLVDRDAPDFVYSGQVFQLPRVPPRKA